jgi:hypothetical protein
MLVGCNLPTASEDQALTQENLEEEILEFEQLPEGLMKTATAIEAQYLSQETPTLPSIPTIESQAPTTIGPDVPGFPEDTPIPAGWVPIPVPAALEAQGYVIAYQFDGFAEEALRDLLAVILVEPSWIVDEVKPLPYASTFIQPFGNMSTGFVAYAFISSTPESIAEEEINGAIIALHSGRYE